MRRQFLGIVLLLAVLVPVPATFVWLEMKREAIHEEMKSLLQEESTSEGLVQIRVDADDHSTLIWKDKKEFLYQAKMYDVVRKEKQGDQIVYYCIQDDRETELEARLNDVLCGIYGKELPGQQSEFQLVQWLHHLDLPPLFSYTLSEEPTITHTFHYFSALPDQPFPIDSPPPQSV